MLTECKSHPLSCQLLMRKKTKYFKGSNTEEKVQSNLEISHCLM